MLKSTNKSIKYVIRSQQINIYLESFCRFLQNEAQIFKESENYRDL